MNHEVEKIVGRYTRRNQLPADFWSPLSPVVCMIRQERERALLRWIRECRIAPLSSKRLIEVGCGSGMNILDFLRLGFRPENLVGNDLLPERTRRARGLLPNTLTILEGNAVELDIPQASFDIVFQSTVFTSILDADFQEMLAQRMWTWVTPGGGVLWYDFIYDNPRNLDVRGVPLRRVRHLFPHGRMKYWRLTLAPPIGRIVTRIHPALYTMFNSVIALRTHVLCWIEKN